MAKLHKRKDVSAKIRVVTSEEILLSDLRALIESARNGTARTVNAMLVHLHWQIGARIRQETLKEMRADYGEEIVATLSRQLTVEFGSGFSVKPLWRMIQFVELFPDFSIVAALSRQLGWSHFVEILPLKDPLQRDFYTGMCRHENWSVRTLRQKIQSMLFERSALSRKPKKLAAQELEALRDEDKLTPDLVFRDPYLLHFLGLKDVYSEKDLETAILADIQGFILELGIGFSFVARQKRIVIDGRDFWIDLLFFHRGLKRLVAVDLKLGMLEAADKGQMELYLRWLDKHERQKGEGVPLGLILCAETTAEHVELLELGKSGIHVGTYLTELPSPEILRKRLHTAMAAAQNRLDPVESDTKKRKR